MKTLAPFLVALFLAVRVAASRATSKIGASKQAGFQEDTGSFLGGAVSWEEAGWRTLLRIVEVNPILLGMLPGAGGVHLLGGRAQTSRLRRTVSPRRPKSAIL